MKNIYYIIWADAILRIRKFHPKEKDWKIKIYSQITWVNALNLWIIFIWLKFFNIFTVPLLRINIFPGKLIDNALAFTIEFALPIGILNYFLIFHKNRYERIVEKYSIQQPSSAYIYAVIIVVGAFISAVLYGILH